MTGDTHTIGRRARRTAMIAVPLLAAATGAASAQMGGHGGAVGGGGWGLFGGMGAGGLLWLVLLLAVPAVLLYGFAGRGGSRAGSPHPRGHRSETDSSLSILRERYARGDISEEEYERRRNHLERKR